MRPNAGHSGPSLLKLNAAVRSADIGITGLEKFQLSICMCLDVDRECFRRVVS